MTVHAPADFGLKRIGHEGAFRKGMEPLWDRMADWLFEPA
jgi:predicted alpha/beta hydrolase